MKKYKNVSGQNVGFLIDGKTYDFQNNEVIAVPDNFKGRIELIVKQVVPYEEPKQLISAPVSAPVEVTTTIAEPKKKGKRK